MIRNSILNFFHVVCVDTTFEGIFVIKLVNKETQYEIAIGVCYLPPDNSEQGRNARSFFDTLLSVIYSLETCDQCIFGGDLNARIGTISLAPTIRFLLCVNCVCTESILAQ